MHATQRAKISNVSLIYWFYLCFGNFNAFFVLRKHWVKVILILNFIFITERATCWWHQFNLDPGNNHNIVPQISDPKETNSSLILQHLVYLTSIGWKCLHKYVSLLRSSKIFLEAKIKKKRDIRNSSYSTAHNVIFLFQPSKCLFCLTRSLSFLNCIMWFYTKKSLFFFLLTIFMISQYWFMSEDYLCSVTLFH